MRRLSATSWVGLICLGLFLIAWEVAAQNTEEGERVAEATVVLSEVMGTPDKAIPKSVLDKAEGIVVFPGTLKGGLVIGAHRGRGILSVRDRQKGVWSSPAFLTLTGGSIGAQIGGQSIDLVLIVMNRRGLENMIRNEFKIGADASVAAGPVGRDAEASTDIQLRAEILSYSRTRGLFAGITLKGSAIKEDQDANQRFYGKAYRTRDIVFSALGGDPDPVPQWKQMLEKYMASRSS